MEQIKYGLALGGGGAKTLPQIAFLQKLENLKITPAYLSGTSMGAFHAVLIAMGYKAKDLYDLYLKYKGPDFFSFSLGVDHIMSNKKLGKLLEKICQKRNYQNLEDLPIKTIICTTDHLTGQAIFISKGSIKEAVMASTATVFAKKIKPNDEAIIKEVCRQTNQVYKKDMKIYLKDGCYAANVPYEGLDLIKDNKSTCFDICLDCVPTFKKYHFIPLDRFNKKVYLIDQKRKVNFLNQNKGLYVELECGLSQVGFSKKNLEKSYKYVDSIFDENMVKKIIK